MAAKEKQIDIGPDLENKEAGLKASNDHVSESINEPALLRKLDLTLLPTLTLLYLLSFLDRSNVGNARIEGLATDLHMTGDQYLTGLTLYFIGYVLFEVPCNLVLKVWSPRLWLPTLTLAWGVVSTLMGVTQSRTGFYIVRFFLGVTESGLFPGKEEMPRSAVMMAESRQVSSFTFLCGISAMRGNCGLPCSSVQLRSQEPLEAFWRSALRK